VPHYPDNQESVLVLAKRNDFFAALFKQNASAGKTHIDGL
jgi:hypothetical protein